MNENTTHQDKTPAANFVQRIEVNARDFASKLEELARDADNRQVIVKDSSGKQIASLPLTAGAVAGGVLALAAPVLAIIAGGAAVLAKLKLEVIRDPKAVSGSGLVDPATQTGTVPDADAPATAEEAARPDTTFAPRHEGETMVDPVDVEPVVPADSDLIGREGSEGSEGERFTHEDLGGESTESTLGENPELGTTDEDRPFQG